ncbi:MAG: DUF2946 domain-containing protein [Phyllobacteriaceae bacterium]|nr:DUF2946 domain-containing protein [Phyllobacteriaceae bacterium]
MKRRIDIARVLIALALIVQIVAPVASNAAVLRMAFDPLVDIIVCEQDRDAVDRREGSDKILSHRGNACDLCRLANAGGYAPPPEPIVLLLPAAAVGHAEWRVSVEAVVGPRLLDHIRGRAPPFFA